MICFKVPHWHFDAWTNSMWTLREGMLMLTPRCVEPHLGSALKENKYYKTVRCEAHFNMAHYNAHTQ